MSTNKSQNLNLHLWEPEDDFLRTEFNENFAAIDTAVKAEETARQTAVSSLQSSISSAGSSSSSAINSLRSELTTKINTAQSTANSAKATAESAYSSSYKPYAVGYSQSSSATISVGFRPSWVLLQLLGDTFVFGDGFRSSTSLSMQLNSSGFSVSPTSQFAGGSFVYVAFR